MNESLAVCGRLVLMWGLVEHFCGYFGLWLAASGRLSLPYWAMVGLTVMAFNGSNWIDTACIATNVHNFPHDRGTVVGATPFLNTPPHDPPIPCNEVNQARIGTTCCLTGFGWCMAGVLKSLVGLSASVYTSIHVAAFRPDALSFLLLIAIAPTVLGLCAMPFFNALPDAAITDSNAKATGALQPSHSCRPFLQRWTEC